MSGHNKWSKIKHKKAITDAKKSKEFSKYARLITAESKNVAGDISSPSLKTLIEKAKAINMPSTNIERAVKKGSEPIVGSEVVYEAYGPSGVAIIIVVWTDNKNRTNAEIKHALTKNSAQQASIGAASWMFEKTEEDYIAKQKISVDEVLRNKLDTISESLYQIDGVESVYMNNE